MEQSIQLSKHVKNKIKSRQMTPTSFISDEVFLSDNTDDEIESFNTSSHQNLLIRRSSTFVTDQIEHLLLTQKKKPLKQIQLCEKCVHRENFFQNEYQRLKSIEEDNKKLVEKLRSLTLLNYQYEEENNKLKQYLNKINLHLQEYKKNFDLLKQQIFLEKINNNNKSKNNLENEHLKRLRHELQVYNQVITAKRKEEQIQIDYFYQFRKK